MALQLVGRKTFGHNATSAQSVSLTDLTGGIATAPAANDVVFVAYNHADGTSVSRTLAQCTPSGYSNLHPTVLTQTSDTHDFTFALTAKQMGGTPDTTVSIPAAAATTANVSVTIEVWRDVDWTRLVDQTATGNNQQNATGINTGRPDPPTITTPSAPAGYVVMGAGGSGTASITALANAGATPYTNFLTGSHATGTASKSQTFIGTKTGLAVNTPFDAVLSGGNTANTGSWGAVSIIIRPTKITATAAPVIDSFTSSSAIAVQDGYDPNWTPADLGSAVKLWLDAQLGVTLNGGAVSAWADQSASGYSFTEGTNQPTFLANEFGPGKHAISFDGTNDRLASTVNFTAIPQPYSVFAVVRDWDTAGYLIVDAYENGGHLYRRPDLGTSGAFHTSLQAYGQYPNATDKALIAGITDDTASKAWVDGVDQTYANPGGTLQFGQVTSSAPMVVGGGGGSVPTQVKVAAIIVVNRLLTASERIKMEAYLARRYYIADQLPSGHSGYQVDPRLAEAAASLGSFTSTMTAKVKIKASVASEINAFTITSASTVTDPHIIGAANPSLGSFTLTAAAKVRVKATAAPAVGSFVPTSVGKVRIKGAAAPSISSFTSTSSGKVRVKASAAPNLDGFVSTSIAKVRIKAAAAPEIGVFTGAMVADVGDAPTSITATAAPILGSFTSTSIGKVQVKATLSKAIDAFTSTGAVKVRTKASATPTIDSFASSAVAKVRIKASASTSLSPFSVSGTIGAVPPKSVSATPSLGNFSSDMTAKVRVKAWTTPRIGSFTASGEIKNHIGATVNRQLGLFTITASADVRIKAQGNPTLDSFTVSSQANLVYPTITAVMSSELGSFTSLITANVVAHVGYNPNLIKVQVRTNGLKVSGAPIVSSRGKTSAVSRRKRTISSVGG
jgi:hypothetical protein